MTDKEALDYIRASLALPNDISLEDIAKAVRICTRHCEQLERKIANGPTSFSFHQPNVDGFELNQAIGMITATIMIQLRGAHVKLVRANETLSKEEIERVALGIARNILQIFVTDDDGQV